MKKIFKSRILCFMLGVVSTIGITSVLAYSILANNVGYTPIDETWKKIDGDNIENTQDAIDRLFYDISSQTRITDSTPSIEKIWQSNFASVNYTYTVVEEGIYLAVTKNSNGESATGNITTTGTTIIKKSALAGANGGTVLHLLHANAGDTINVNAYNRNSSYTANGFIVKLNNIYGNTLVDFAVTNDATATKTYTATRSGERILAVAISNSTNRSASITYTGKHLTTIFRDDYICVDYALLGEGATIKPAAYGYNWGGGAVFLIK